MTSTERSLLEKLVELEQTIKAMPSAEPKPNLLPLFTAIDELAAELPVQREPTLRHYLQKRSYEKARLYLQGLDAKNAAGACCH